MKIDKSKGIEYALLSVSIIAILISAFMITPYLVSKINVENKENIEVLGMTQSFLKLSPVLNVTTLDSDGNIKGQEIKEDDLILTNFLDLLVALFTDSNGDTVSFTAKDTGGSTRTFNVYGGDTLKFFNDLQGSSTGGKIGIGNGTTSPARTDYSLVSPQESFMAVSSPSYGGGNITFSAAVSVTDNYSVSEVGFALNLFDSIPSTREILSFRDIFTPIPVVVGDQIITTYTIYLNNTGFTDNFGQFLTALFQHTNSDKTFQMTDIAASTDDYFIYQDSATPIATTLNRAIGTRSLIGMSGSSGAIARNTIAIVVLNNIYVGIAEPTHNTSTILMTASRTMLATGGMNSAGYFVVWHDDAAALHTILFWALNFTTVNYIQDYTVTVSFRWIT